MNVIFTEFASAVLKFQTFHFQLEKLQRLSSHLGLASKFLDIGI